jgi:cellulose synthase/poly-beta-1,6-N-acetylglucosamine synthase-like glycosyltransferase
MARALSEPRRVGLTSIPSPRRHDWPYVGVVIATRNRPHLVRRALASVTAQDYPGPIRVVVVYDDVAPDWRLAGGGDRPVLVLENWRTAGLAGARNTGILAAGDCELVAFCDDADTWSPAKLTTQVRAMRSRPGTLFVTCAAEIEYGGRRTPRLSGRRDIDLAQLARGRGGLPASGFLARQDALATEPTRGGIGLVTEDGPAAGAEWDLLLRAARRATIVNVDLPLVRVLWRRTEIDPAACAERAGALRWLAGRHPELAEEPAVAAHLYAEIACWEAAAGRTRAAREWARAALRERWYAPRASIGAAAASGLLRGRSLRGVLRRLLA